MLATSNSLTLLLSPLCSYWLRRPFPPLLLLLLLPPPLYCCCLCTAAAANPTGAGWCEPGHFCGYESTTTEPSKCLPLPKDCGKAGQPCCPSNTDSPHTSLEDKMGRKPYCKDGSTCFYFAPVPGLNNGDMYAGNKGAAMGGWVGGRVGGWVGWDVVLRHWFGGRVGGRAVVLQHWVSG